MLRITVHAGIGALTIQLEGRLIGPWVGEAEASRQKALASNPNLVPILDLTGVTMVDAAGKTFLAAAHTQGTKLVASGCLMRAIVADIVRSIMPNARVRECQ